MKLLKKKEKKKEEPSSDGYEKWKRELPARKTLMLMPREFTEEFRAFVFEKNNGTTKIAAVSPGDSGLQRFTQERLGDTTEWFRATEDDISYILKHYTKDFKDEISRLLSIGVDANEHIVELVELIIGYAIAEKASDIHIEPDKNESIVRFRVDGILHKTLTLPKDIRSAVMARFKLLANLKIDDHRNPQDGRIELENFANVSLRISTMPMLHGEKIVLRVLDDSDEDLSIKSLGFSEKHEQIIIRNTEKPFGMIIASGPTGSGKTTTLYGLLHLLAKDRINISTLEDPIEYAVAGINQVQINPKINLTFASGLRSLLRQDPDVIMVGEIRDSETAVMSAEAALTGHLVLTTVHTNDAPSAITRFSEMKVEEFALASTINIIIAQRLVRKICDSCAQEKKLDKVVFKKLEERKDILESLKAMKRSIKDMQEHKFRIGTGCDACMNTGYHGRVGIFEILEVDKTIHDLIIGHADPERIKTAAKKNGFRDMIADGLEKVFNGTTTLEEVLRVTRTT